ncbi:MAG: dTMP kinase [Porcipelethomonas sp.]
MPKTENRGRFIAFEGIDGSGKSTQISALKKRLVQKGISCFETREPTDSPIGSLIHNIMTGRIKTDNRAIASLFAADRIDHLTNDRDGLCGKIEAGTTVITDRYYFSSYAYHSVDMPMELVISENSICAQLLRPDCTVFIDIPPETAMERIAAGRDSSELFETLERLTLVRSKYMEAFERLKDSEQVIIIDGTLPPDKVSEEIWKSVSPFFDL